jgi:hypothetical protein
MSDLHKSLLLNYCLPGLGVAALFAIASGTLLAALLGFPVGVFSGVLATINLSKDEPNFGRSKPKGSGRSSQTKIPPLIWFGVPPTGAIIGFSANFIAFGGVVNGLLGVPVGLTVAFFILMILSSRTTASS